VLQDSSRKGEKGIEEVGLKTGGQVRKREEQRTKIFNAKVRTPPPTIQRRNQKKRNKTHATKKNNPTQKKPTHHPTRPAPTQHEKIETQEPMKDGVRGEGFHLTTSFIRKNLTLCFSKQGPEVRA